MADQRKNRLASAWSELPQEIISNIKRRLDSSVDVFQLLSVCKNWHSSRKSDNVSILSPFLPQVISNFRLPFIDRQNEPVILIARAVFLVKPLRYSSASRGWLLTVEEMVPGKLRILYPLSTDHVEFLPSNFPIYLDLSKFKVKQVAKTYGFKYSSDAKDVPGVRRVVVCSTSTAMVLYGGGTLIIMKLKSGVWSFIRCSIFTSFSDVISYDENNARAIDCEGNMHIIDHRTTKVVETISSGSIFQRSSCIMLLVSNGNTYAVAYVTEGRSNGLAVYRLNETTHTWFDDANNHCYEKVLFVSSDWSFFLYARDLYLNYYLPKKPRKRRLNEDILGSDDEKETETITGDYAICSKNSSSLSQCFSVTSRVYERASINLQIGVFFFKSVDYRFWTRANCSREVTKVLWPPPTWFWPETGLSTSEDEDLDIHSHRSSPYSADASNEVKALNEKNNPRLIFHGIEVQAEHLPVLQDFWKKHGDVFEGSLVRSRDARAMALACLAKILIVLQSLDKGFDIDQAEYVESTLSDLKFMGLKLEWLVPLVEQALAHQKQLHADLVALEEAKSKVEKAEERLLAVIAEVKQGLSHNT